MPAFELYKFLLLEKVTVQFFFDQNVFEWFESFEDKRII